MLIDWIMKKHWYEVGRHWYSYGIDIFFDNTYNENIKEIHFVYNNIGIIFFSLFLIYFKLNKSYFT